MEIAKHFHFAPDWYRNGDVRDLVPQYYFLLRSVLSSQPHLRRFLSRCRHCGIFFFADPRNAGRRDLGCPFGCAAAHRKRSSNNRSLEYYRLDKQKKRAQNRKRYQRDVTPPPPVAAAPVPGDRMLNHVRMFVSLIEGRRVGRDEILDMLAKFSRQHSMSRRNRMDYLIQYLDANPP